MSKLPLWLVAGLMLLLSSPVRGQYPPNPLTPLNSCHPWQGDDSWCNWDGDEVIAAYRVGNDERLLFQGTIGGVYRHFRWDNADVWEYANGHWRAVTDCVEAVPAMWGASIPCEENTEQYFKTGTHAITQS